MVVVSRATKGKFLILSVVFKTEKMIKLRKNLAHCTLLFQPVNNHNFDLFIAKIR